MLPATTDVASPVLVVFPDGDVPEGLAALLLLVPFVVPLAAGTGPGAEAALAPVPLSEPGV